MDNQSSVYTEPPAREISGLFRTAATSLASLRIGRITTPRSSWTLPSGQSPLGYLPRQVLRPATV